MKIKLKRKVPQISQAIGIINMIRLKVKRGYKLKQNNMKNNIKTPSKKKYFKEDQENFSRLQEGLSQKPKKKKISQLWRMKCKWWVINELRPVPYSKSSKQSITSLRILEPKHKN